MKISYYQQVLARGGVVATILCMAIAGSLVADPKADEAALKRARKQVKMLDEIYKTAIVLITKEYVTEKSNVPAGEAFQLLFAAMKKGGYHEVRLLDATGEPINPDNSPQDAFEKAAIAALLKGKPGYEEVIEKEGKKYLRSATPIPVVLDKCIMCHEHYQQAKEKKQIIGSLGYTIPIE